jgi:hypothetical protein
MAKLFDGIMTSDGMRMKAFAACVCALSPVVNKTIREAAQMALVARRQIA